MSVSQPSFHSLKSLLHLQDVSVYHHKVALLKQLNLTVKEGSFHCLVGESGSGKSLLARTALNMLQPELHYTGQVDINLEDTDAMFQDTNSNFFQNVRIQKHFDALFDSVHSKLSRQEQHHFVERQFNHLGLKNNSKLLDYYPFQLSGGMAQRIALIMSIVREAKFLIADEPTSALDYDNRNHLMLLLHHVIQQHGMTILFITHDLELVIDYATHISVMYEGQIVESGTSKEVLTFPQHPYTQKLIDLANRRTQYVTD
ncbi:ATP-binding cassette domain-containing protein [Staphylococcus lugdunensis]|uniref:ATP-binding cassette domain-containing protein n=1 Tax=Staphylococcus lugdunensis TaxID=28035 RepID=UPI001F4CDC78|nr:ATP-binding cassette domain-containing protein [Staphylococcus lugdunensis]MCH8656624.1 ATP-binding cassette domain-containing protein [Staphylococcus lugdunensis]